MIDDNVFFFFFFFFFFYTALFPRRPRKLRPGCSSFNLRKLLGNKDSQAFALLLVAFVHLGKSKPARTHVDLSDYWLSGGDQHGDKRGGSDAWLSLLPNNFLKLNDEQPGLNFRGLRGKRAV